MSAAIQSAFAARLFEATPAPTGLMAWNAATPECRYDVYRNNVTASLTNALASRFPAAERIVGSEFFRAMAQAFIRRHPPRSPLLLAYGDDFPDFAAAFEPAGELAYLPDVMRLETARGRAYHAADAVPLDPQSLTAVDPSRLGSLTFTPHPSLSLLSSSHPVVTIWAMNVGESSPAPINDWRGEDAVIVRPHMVVDVVPLMPGGVAFFRRLADGVTLAGAAEAAMAADTRFDLSTNLAVLLRSGAFTAFKQENADEHRHNA